MVRQVEPLRIAKAKGSSSASASPVKATSRPLAEIGSTEKRRNSPSYNQATRKQILSHDTSPYTENSSPPSFHKPSPRDFWSTRELLSPSRFDSENTPERSPSPAASPRRRPSVERLQKAGRVKTSNIFALETKDAYDPSSLPIVERPSANRPLSEYLVNNSFARADSMRKENNPFRSPGKSGHKRTESEIHLPTFSPSKHAFTVPLPVSPEKQSPASPTKSSLSRNSQFGGNVFDELDAEDRVPTPRALHRHAKSVTFHDDPPEINEYEHPTPEPSVSVASDREGSWDSEDFEDNEYSFERYSSAEPDREDSFDADLENADKTPVVLPEDWSRMSPDEARTNLVDQEDDVFDAAGNNERPGLGSRIASDSSESRPLPPIPGFTLQERRGSGGLASAAERAAHATRNVPSPPKRASCSKEDILKMRDGSSLSLQDRLGLMGAGKDAERPSSKSSQETVQEELTVTNLDTGERRDFHVEVTEKPVEGADDSLADMSAFVDAPPRISRESILRKVRGTKYDFDDEDDDVEESQYIGDDDATRPTIQELAHMNPDQPIPSRENSRETSEHHMSAEAEEQRDEVFVKPEPVDDDQIDLNSIPAAAHERSPSRMDEYDRQNSVLHHGMPRSDSESIADDDTASRYSSEAPDAESTMLHHTQTTLPTEVSAVDEGKETLDDAMALLTVRDYAEAAEPTRPTQGSGEFEGLPAYLASEDFDFGMQEYITPPGSANSHLQANPLFGANNMPNLQLPADPEPPQAPYVEREISPPDSPASVIHKPDDSDVPFSPIDGPPAVEEAPAPVQKESPEIPERKSTIRTSGKLKTRKSGTPADLESMAEQRRMVSMEMRENPVPAIPQQYQTAAGAHDAERPASSDSQSQTDSLIGEEKIEKTPNRRKSRKSGGRLDLMLDTSTWSIGDSDGLGLDSEFDKVIEAQKVRHQSAFPPPLFARFAPAAQQEQQRGSLNDASARDAHDAEHTAFNSYPPQTHDCQQAGANRNVFRQKGYLMRQNTKLVVATNRNVSGSSNDTAASNATVDSNDTPLSPTAEATPRPGSSSGRSKAKGSTRKPSAEQYLKTEPWVGKQRRKSLRNASAAKTAPYSGPAPPLPGQESALGVVDEDFAAGTGSLEDEVGDDVERGRLFVKVVGVKELDLPLPRNDRVDFQLTLDNGLHCVTTTSIELGKSAPIGQEFELVVLNDLEFQLTLSTNLPPPPKEPIQLTPSSPTKSPHKSGGAFSRFLSSPKKRAEKERQEREAAEAEERRLQAEAARKRASRVPTAWDLLHDLVNGSDGSFARAYVNLKSHEQQCFGRQLTVDVPCYNEWAAERDNTVINSVRSKRGTQSGPVRRPPYVVGKLELQLLYVPKARGGTDEDMPKSMSTAVREMNKASQIKEIVHEGHLSQQGGDCTHWRRRFFRLQNSRLTAYHEHTHQKRAVINLSKASRLVDDKTTLVADLTSSSPSKSGRRRKSGFAEEDEGYQYVEEGFRIRFANGETIDFYADSRALKDEWMVQLSQVIGKPDAGAKKEMKWTDLVLARERTQGAPSLGGQGVEVKDFSNSSSSLTKSGGEMPPLPPKRELSHRKPVVPPPQQQMGNGGSKSVPSSPAKKHGYRMSMPVNELVPDQGSMIGGGEGNRAPTPPMGARRGHRSRDAVKSMIF